MGMDQFLAEYYGTTKTAAQEDLEKEASVELFIKLAAEENIDLSSMPDAQVQQLYDTWLQKSAEEEEKKEPEKKDEKEKKVEEAKEEHEEKKAMAEKVAEADFLGRVMAHAMVQETREIVKSAEAEKDAGAKELAGKAGEKLKNLGEHAAKAGKRYGELLTGSQAKPGPLQKIEKRKVLATQLATGGAALGAAGGTAAAIHHHNKKKESSAIDELAFEQAQLIAKEAGFDPDEAAARISAAYTLGLVEESTKVAAASDLETAVYARALEQLEQVGYPVNWE